MIYLILTLRIKLIEAYRNIIKEYDGMMNRLIIPIYPIEGERIYNAHIKARTFAGCNRAKKWFIFTKNARGPREQAGVRPAAPGGKHGLRAG